jgi:arginase family enzyme
VSLQGTVGGRPYDRPFLGTSGGGDGGWVRPARRPSSAAAHGPGQEKAPAALRRAGLPQRLVAAGVHLADYGDLPVVGWRPDPHQRRPHLPVADIPPHNAGLTFDEAMRCLTVFARNEGLAGLTITEFNPDHGAKDGSTTDTLVPGLVGARRVMPH